MWSTSSLTLLSSPPWPEVVAPDRVLSMGPIELVDNQTQCKQRTYVKSNC